MRYAIRISERGWVYMAPMHNAQPVNVMWLEAKRGFIDNFADAAGISTAQSAWHLAMLCNVVMGFARDGDISKLDKEWVSIDMCTWPGEPDSFFEALETAGMLERNHRGRPARITCARELCRERLEAYQAEAERKRAERAEKAKLKAAHPPDSEQQSDRASDVETFGVSEGTEQQSGQGPESERSREQSPDVRVASADTTRKNVALSQYICKYLADCRVKIPISEVQDYLNRGVEPVVLIWAADAVSGSGANSPNSYFHTVVDDKIGKGAITYKSLRDSECRTAFEKNKFDLVYGKRGAYA